MSDDYYSKTDRYVYFLQVASRDEPIKIGCSCDPWRRRKEFQAWNHQRITLIATCPGGYWTEKSIHREFSHLCIRGEWFRSEGELYNNIIWNAEIQRFWDGFWDSGYDYHLVERLYCKDEELFTLFKHGKYADAMHVAQESGHWALRCFAATAAKRPRELLSDDERNFIEMFESFKPCMKIRGRKEYIEEERWREAQKAERLKKKLRDAF